MQRILKQITILGSTGSIGLSTLDVIARHPDRYQVFALTANISVEKLAEQIIAFRPRYAVLRDAESAELLEQRLSNTDSDTELLVGDGALQQVAADAQVDYVMAAIVGGAGLLPTLAAVKAGKRVLLANKEALVMSGELFMQAASDSGAELLPIDSEHNAVFQVFEPENKAALKRIILTASGGPFRTMSLSDMEKATPEQALAHPNWSMGDKISIDSATMMNKALEVIEAQRLFDVALDQIEVLVHPQSIIHSMVEYQDGSILAQMGAADMCTPITNALGWPKRLKTPGQTLDLTKMKHLDFEPVDSARFPFVGMAYECLKSGLNACITMNAANEAAVAAFLGHKIAFLDIYKLVSKSLDNMQSKELNSLNDVIEYDSFVRAQTESAILGTTTHKSAAQ